MSELENFNSTTVKLWRIPLILGLLFVLFGVIMIKNPLSSFYALSIIIGCILIISGIVEIYFFGNNRKHTYQWSFFLSGGLIDLLLGIILITNPKIILIVLSFSVSLWLIYKAIIAIRKAIELKNTKNKNWVWVLVFGILILAITILLIMKPQILGAAVGLWIAVSFIVFGVYRIFLALQLRSIIRE